MIDGGLFCGIIIEYPPSVSPSALAEVCSLETTVLEHINTVGICSRLITHTHRSCFDRVLCHKERCVSPDGFVRAPHDVDRPLVISRPRKH